MIEKTSFAVPRATVDALVGLYGFAGAGATAKALRAVIDEKLVAAGRQDACSGNQVRPDGRRIAGTPEASARAKKSWETKRAERAEFEAWKAKKSKKTTNGRKKMTETGK